MIKKDYLSEVETLYVQREALVPAKVPRLFVVWADVGQGVHGFVAVREDLQGGVVKFKPVTDVVALQNYVERAGTDSEFEVDYRKRKPEDLLWLIVGSSAWKDEEAICAEEPVLDVTALPDIRKQRAVLYSIMTVDGTKAAVTGGVAKGKVGWMPITDQAPAEDQVRAMFQPFPVDIVLCEEMDFSEAQEAERNTLKGLRAAFKCGVNTDWYELRYPIGTDWDTGGRDMVAGELDGFRMVGEELTAQGL